MILHRVVGPPGCGKTTYLTRQAALAARKYGGSGVCIASLTRAAAKEVGSRAQGIPHENVGTLHSHAYRALSQPAIAETAEGLSEWNQRCGSSSYRISPKYAVDPENAKAEQQSYDTDGAQLLADMNVLRARMTPQEMWPPRIRRFADRWEAFKQATGRLDFTDLIERALDEVDEHPAAPAVFMLDEAQDMSRMEMGLAMKWGAEAEQLVIVGDPDQNLYQWRGSDPAAFYAGQAASSRVLDQSYRVPEAVVQAATAWIEQIPDRPEVVYQPRREDPADPDSPYVAGTLRHANHTWGAPEALVREIDERLAVYDQTVMVLTSCAYMLSPLIDALRAQGVAFHNPYRITNGAWNPMRGARRLLSFLRPSGEAWPGESRMWTWQELRAWTEPLGAKGVLTRGSKSLIESKGAGRTRFGEQRGQEVLDLETVLELVEEEHWKEVIGMDIGWWAQHLRHTERRRNEYAVKVAKRRGVGALRRTPKLTIGTIHSVKGGEADVVYVFPDISPQAFFGGWRKPPGNAGRDAIVRQFYVAQTRAREELVLCRPTGAEAVKWT